jgi:hypothetical protein
MSSAIATQFIQYCDEGNIDEVEEILNDYQPETGITDEDYFNAFLSASNNSHIEILQLLLDANPDLVDITANDNIIFRTACKNGYIKLAKWLLDKEPGIHIDAHDDDAFKSACENGHLNIVKWLYELEPEIVTTYDTDKTAFTLACKNGHLKVAKWLFHIYKKNNTFPTQEQLDKIWVRSSINNTREITDWISYLFRLLSEQNNSQIVAPVAPVNIQMPEDIRTQHCYDVVSLDDPQISIFLAEHRENFITAMQLSDKTYKYSCNSLQYMNQMNKNKSIYECNDNAPVNWQGNSYVGFLKPGGRNLISIDFVGSQLYIEKPRWIWDGPVPEPRIFVFVKQQPIFKFVTSDLIPTMIPGFNALGANHCNQTGPQDTYMLVPFSETAQAQIPPPPPPPPPPNRIRVSPDFRPNSPDGPPPDYRPNSPAYRPNSPDGPPPPLGGRTKRTIKRKRSIKRKRTIKRLRTIKRKRSIKRRKTNKRKRT